MSYKYGGSAYQPIQGVTHLTSGPSKIHFSSCSVVLILSFEVCAATMNWTKSWTKRLTVKVSSGSYISTLWPIQISVESRNLSIARKAIRLTAMFAIRLIDTDAPLLAASIIFDSDLQHNTIKRFMGGNNLSTRRIHPDSTYRL